MRGRRKLACLFPSYASAHDLRSFELEMEKNGESSSRGVVEGCACDLSDERVSTKTTSTTAKNQWSNWQATSNWRRLFKLWRGRTMRKLPSFPPFGSRTSRSKSMRSTGDIATDFRPIKSSWNEFSFSELQAATNNFSQENLIGEGGCAEVFKGCLRNGQLVAVKRLNKGSLEEQSVSFLSEVGIIAHVNHPNTAKMIGYGVEGGTYLVLQLSSLGSLGSLLHGSKIQLDWEARYKIILGTADGLLYLHESCQRRIIHRDIKADNILLTENFEPQICDFGIAKWLPKQWTHYNVSKFEGTFGYFAPEYFMDGIVDEKTDVFAFGVLLLEIVTGRKPVDESQKCLVLWAKPLLETNNLEELVDPTLCNNYNAEEMDRVILTASLCIERNPILRPRMSQVVTFLGSNAGGLECPKEHRKKFLQRTYSEEIFDVEEYNSTKYLMDLNQLKATAFSTWDHANL